MIKGNYLAKIIERKKGEIATIKENLDPNDLIYKILKSSLDKKSKFQDALKQPTLAVIAEIKRASPSRGDIASIADPISLALQYCEGGATAISVLTDEVGFNGSLRDLTDVANAVKKAYPAVAILRKDFIIDPIQLAQAVVARADAVLLIVNALGEDKLIMMLEKASSLGLEVLTEVHDEQDLEIALRAGAEIIGINNRDLSTFQVDLATSHELRDKIPSYVVTVSESGIEYPEQAQQMRAHDFDAVLVGTALVQSGNPIPVIQQMRAR